MSDDNPMRGISLLVTSLVGRTDEIKDVLGSPESPDFHFRAPISELPDRTPLGQQWEDTHG